MDNELHKELREYAWNYFSLHAEQRIKTFHFFVILSTVITGAILTIIKDFDKIVYASPLAFLLSIFSFVFWKLDHRNKALIKHGENALKCLEEVLKKDLNSSSTCIEPTVLQLFAFEEWKTNKKLRFPKAPLSKAHFSYSDCFNVVFFIFGVGSYIFGCLIIALSFA